ncbi:sortase [Polaromonas sp.]|nr:sortase [Candidatus Saccharibacteria bacterium]
MTLIIHKPSVTLCRINHFLTALVVLIAIYIMLFPFLPSIQYWIHRPREQAPAVVQVTKNNPPATTPIPDGALLKIPRLDMTEEIHTGPSIYELNKGPWLVPRTSTPDKASNTVVVGHRFTYAGPAVFYFLDKIQVNDRITVDWQHKEYTYKVASISVVQPSQLEVQNPTDKPQLTLYTCTPLVTAKNRLVIVAPLVGVRS